MKDPGDRPLKDPAARRANRKRLRAFKKTVGRNIERIRKAQGIPLRTLARKTGFSAIKLDYWEMGRMTIPLDAILRIAGVLKVSHERLLTMPQGIAEETPAATAEETPGETAEPEDKPKAAIADGWKKEPEVELYRAIHRRAAQQAAARKEGKPCPPDRESLMAMEEPLCRLMRGTVLLHDVARAGGSNGGSNGGPRRSGLDFLAGAISREAEAIYRLYTGYATYY